MESLDPQTMTERKLINMPHVPKGASLNISADNVLGTPPHQYHYIQYYHQHNNPQAVPCQCNCSCSKNKQKQSSYQHNFQQPQQRQQQEYYHSQRLISNHTHQGSIDSQRVAVIVHRQASGSASSSIELSNINNDLPPKKAQSETSLLNHSYQALKMSESLNENLLNSMTKLKTGSSCDCDLECTCEIVVTNRKDAKQYALTEAMLTADEITVSESDNNSNTVKRCERNQNKKLPLTKGVCHDSGYNNANHIDIYSDGDGDGDGTTDACLKEKNGAPHDSEDGRPPLPPRPPPRPQTMTTHSNGSNNRHGTSIKKYVIWCLICGGVSCILGLLFLGVYFLLHSYTITVGNFETVPTFVPATLLILTGLCIMSLARRRNRYSYLIKLSGACGLISALTCALVTVTTTVLHMSRLQALRECEYAQKTRTCTCYSDMIESQVDRVDKEGVRLVFDSLSDCGVVHGSLYSCLRAIFGLSVAGVLIAVFSCMLVYQLLSHERKKMYWEQLELRCRSLYTRQQIPPQNLASASAAHGCRCCEQCHTHRQVPIQAVAYPWDENGEPRFWSSQPPGNFYSPNPGGEDLNACRSHDIPNSRSRGSGWSWNRWWQRNSPDGNSRFRQTPSSPDSQYGFSNNTAMPVNAITEEMPSTDNQNLSHSFNVLPGNLPYGVWGPPPPYSDPNSPARRVFYQYLQETHAMNANMSHNPNSQINANLSDSAHPGSFIEQPATSNCCSQSAILRSVPNAISKMPSKGGYENTPSDSDCGSMLRERDRFSNTLPSRKIKKRLDPGNKSIGPNSQNTARVSAQQIFSNIANRNEEHSYQQTQNINAEDPRNVCGMENTGFQNSNENTNSGKSAEEPSRQESSDPTESEVYFADVSSCCNVSVKNDHYYEDAKASQRTLIPAQQNLHHSHTHDHSHHHQHAADNCVNSKNEDYLAQRFGQRENSIRSRLPFPQNATHNEGFVDNLKIITNNPSDNQNHSRQQIPKDVSRQSMCSLDSEAKTEFTDLSPSTPCSGKLAQLNDFHQDPVPVITDQTAMINTTFVASYPYSSESQSLEAHKRSTKNLDDNTSVTINLRNMPRAPNKPPSGKKSTITERSDNADRERLNDGNSYERQRL